MCFITSPYAPAVLSLMDVAMEANWGKKNQTANNVSANDCTGGDEKYRRHKLVKQEI